jgi:transposase
VDLHKHYLLIGGLDAQHQVVLTPRRVVLSEWPDWAARHLQPSDVLVVETTTNTWDFVDAVQPHVARVVVAATTALSQSGGRQVKTDRRDTLALARLLAAGLLTPVWVPPPAVRELRGLLAYRRRLLKQQTMLQNQLHSLLHRHQMLPPSGDLFGAAQRAWWAGLPLSPTEQLHVRQGLASLTHLAGQVAEVQTELERLSTTPPWASVLPYLLQLPGFGLVLSLTVLAAVGDITRFEDAKHLVGYAGLGSAVHASGETHRTGGITKRGRRDLRWALAEAAWVAVRTHPFWQAEFERLSRRMARNAAITVIARKLLVAVWHVLSEQVADVHAQPEAVARKFLAWAGHLTPQQRGGRSTGQFARAQLQTVKLAADLTHVGSGAHRRRLPPVAAPLAG